MSAIKLAVMGSGSVGKSAMCVRYCNGTFVTRYDPTIEDTFRKQVEVGGQHYVVEILDTAGTEHFTAMRDIYIRNGEGFLLVYSIASEGTFKEVDALKDLILDIHGEDLPIMLIGNKIDLEDKRVVSTQQGKDKARSWDCLFLETSAKTNVNVTEAFVGLVELISRKRMAENSKKGRKNCILL